MFQRFVPIPYRPTPVALKVAMAFRVKIRIRGPRIELTFKLSNYDRGL